MSISRRRKSWLSVAALASAAVLLAACSGSATPSTSSASSTSAPSGDVMTTPATITLFSSAGLEAFSQGLADAFTAKYPDITVELQVEADDNYNTVLPRLLASDSPPDISAPSDLIQAVDDGLVANLDDYAAEYGWADKVPSTILAAGRVENSTIGSGSLYKAGGAAGPLVGVFYHRDLAAQVGMTEVPATLDDLEAVMANAKSMGITPIVASNSDGLIGHLYNLLLAQYMGPQTLLDVVWHQPGATLDSDAARQATAKLEDWMSKGYFNDDANALNQDASYGEFAAGHGLFMVQGTWITGALPESFAGQYGIFPLPPKDADTGLVSMTGNSLGYSVSENSDNKDAAALFIDFLSTPEAAAVANANGYPTAAGSEATPVTVDMDATEQIQAGYASVGADNGFTEWLQNADATMTPAMRAELQSMLAGQTTADHVVDTLQQAYAAAVG